MTPEFKSLSETSWGGDSRFSQAILDALPANVAVLNREGVIVAVNRSWRQFAGENDGPSGVGVNYLNAAGQATGPFSEEAQAAIHGIRSVLDGSLPQFSLEYPCLSPTKRRWFMMQVTPVTDIEPRTVVVMHHDITERKLAEEKAREADLIRQTITDNATTAILVADQENRCVFMNPSGEALTGFKFEEIKGRNLHDILHHTHPDGTPFPASECPIGKAVKALQALRGYEDVFVKKDGTFVSVLCQIKPLINHGNLTGVVVELVDITSRKEAEESLRANEHQFRLLTSTLETRLRQQQAVAELGMFALTTPEFDKLLYKCVETVRQVLDNECCKVLELQADGQSLLLRAGVGWKEGLVGIAKVPADRGSQAGYTLVSNEPVVVADLRTETRFTGPQLLFDHGVVSGMSVVIAGSEPPFGVLGTHSRQYRDYSKDDVFFLQSVANILAGSIERQKIERRHRLLVHSVQDFAIVMLDPKGNVTTWNAGAERITGYTAAEVIGQSVAMFYPPENVAAGNHVRELEQAANEGRIAHEGWRLGKGGTRLLAECITFALRDDSGRLLGFSRVLRDTTVQRREEGALRSAMEHSVDAIFTIDQQGIVQSLGGAAQSIFGYTPAEVVGNNISMLMPEPWRHEHDGYIANYVRTGEAKVIGSVREVTGLRKDGSTVPLELVITESRIEGRRFFTGILRDVTKRKQTEETLASAQRRLQHVVASSPAVLFTMKVDGDTLRPVWMSDNLRTMLGYSAEDYCATNWWRNAVHPDDLDQARTNTRQLLFTQDQVANEYRFRHKNGNYRWLRCEMLLVRDAAGQPLETVGSWSDITERKQLEDQLRQSQKMEAIGQLAGGVAHDFNNLLTIINGYAEIVMTAMQDDNPHRGLLAEVIKAGNRAASLTSHLLAFSRKQILAPKVLDLNAAVESSEKMLRRMIGEDILLVTVYDRSLHRVKVDPSQIEQAIMNLAVNARDAMPQGGTLSIGTCNMNLDEEQCIQHPGCKPGRYAAITMTDTGSGMAPEVKARIFEPFYTTKDVGKGTGLGLAMVYGIVKQSEGYIAVDSTVGVGTTFKILLPAVMEKADSPRPDGAPLTPRRGNETVLLVEDENAMRKLARHILEMHGYNVLEANNGMVATQLERTHVGPIHLVITDVVMPGMSGRQLVESILPRRPGMKVLYMSGYTDDAFVRHGIKDAGNAFLPKPFSLPSLAKKVREVLDTKA